MIALLGSNGQLGQDLQRALHAEKVTPLTRQDLDVTDHGRARTLLLDLRPDVILNNVAECPCVLIDIVDLGVIATERSQGAVLHPA